MKLMAADPDPIDVIVGKNVKNLRIYRGHSQSRVAEALDITFQQIQKYERGANRISASKLVQIADLLDVRIERLFEGASNCNPRIPALELSATATQVGFSYDRLPSDRLRNAIMLLLSALGGGPFDHQD